MGCSPHAAFHESKSSSGRNERHLSTHRKPKSPLRRGPRVRSAAEAQLVLGQALVDLVLQASDGTKTKPRSAGNGA